MRPEFRAIFDAECSYVHHSLRRLGVHERDLEDVAHDVFVTVHKKLDDYDTTRPIRPWIFGIAMRVASDYRRLARHRRETMDDAIEAVDSAPAVDDRIETAQAHRDARGMVMEALDALDFDKRVVFVMHEIDGEAIPQVATALSIPLNTAYSRLRLAREQFAAAVKRLRARGESRVHAATQARAERAR